jgi:hypothetical protein
MREIAEEAICRRAAFILPARTNSCSSARPHLDRMLAAADGAHVRGPGRGPDARRDRAHFTLDELEGNGAPRHAGRACAGPSSKSATNTSTRCAPVVKGETEIRGCDAALVARAILGALN